MGCVLTGKSHDRQRPRVLKKAIGKPQAHVVRDIRLSHPTVRALNKTTSVLYPVPSTYRQVCTVNVDRSSSSTVRRAGLGERDSAPRDISQKLGKGEHYETVYHGYRCNVHPLKPKRV
jgi:hypothetical protein